MSPIKLLYTKESTVNEAIKLLDTSGIGILPVVDADNKLLGIITDGDIRRAVLSQQITMDHIINRKPRTLSHKTPRLEIVRKLKELHLRHMPLLDENGRLADVFCLENLVVETKSTRVIIMAGGLGSRLGDLTKALPKPMLPIGGRPILERIIEDLRLQGFKSFTLCLNYKAGVIQEHFGDGSDFGVSMSYTFEDKRLGTAGALSLLDKSSVREPFIVLNGDILTHVDFEDLLQFHTSSGAQATMCVRPQDIEVPFACVSFDEGSNLIELTEKPKIQNFINCGIYVLNPEVLDVLPNQEFYDMPTLFQDLIASKRNVKAYRFQDFWVDIGLPEDYQRMKDDYSSGRK